MNKLHAGLLAAAAVAGTLVTTLAWAHHGGRHHHHHRHARVGVYVGAPLLWSPFWHPYPYSYPPATIVVRPAAPVVYVEQADAALAAAPAPQAQQQYWHYCADTKTYYPYVNTCASPWQRVIPHPPPPPVN